MAKEPLETIDEVYTHFEKHGLDDEILATMGDLLATLSYGQLADTTALRAYFVAEIDNALTIAVNEHQLYIKIREIDALRDKPEEFKQALTALCREVLQQLIELGFSKEDAFSFISDAMGTEISNNPTFAPVYTDVLVAVDTFMKEFESKE
jgi:hypothetical protein